jgi:hypothetical protein
MFEQIWSCLQEEHLYLLILHINILWILYKEHVICVDWNELAQVMLQQQALLKMENILTSFSSKIRLSWISYKFTHSFTHGAEPFLRSRQLCSYTRISQHFMEPEGLLPCSQEPSTEPYHEPDRSNPYHPILSLRSILILSTPTPTLKDHPLSGCPRLLIKYIRRYPSYLEAVSSVRNLRTRHAAVTRDPPNMGVSYNEKLKWVGQSS